MQNIRGFTLIELMIVVVIISILAMIVVPSYQAYIRKSQEAKVESQILLLSEQLERHKARNFNYKNFNMSANLPSGFTLKIVDLDDTAQTLNGDSVLGRGWMIQVLASDNKVHNYLMSSDGLKCKSLLPSEVKFKCNGDAKTW
ncbi:type IV pilin protein [Acinetobacter sp. YH12102]|uniref:type IV pilin protein n=1 Tax=Acinetobacter sp. YH12102 TaxID=2601091 RepID=UPI0015D21F67|nr:prepilin-type N-terminal cleavage/methylation domain-containing protein [Acinetobacter sp. YH12102]